MTIAIKPIGVVASPVTETIDEGWGDVVSEIRLRPDLAAGLRGLESFTHVIVVFWMHASEFDSATHLVRHHRDRTDMPKTGIFAQRARHRPNPIGITPVRLIGIDGATIRVQGLDAIDGTPVLDVKPHVPAFDRIDEATVPAYIDLLMADYF
ncbi:MAG: tRNA (N6-threonylcarbamoyladenosine(37)-N6)-methyltransferase TrmO [Chloroflexi bacterium]|nr:tRNA (N6-threonylcarbamoyladenosine(37)-N6)-methyltransferase TrmO [Chloroflexota bacterium]